MSAISKFLLAVLMLCLCMAAHAQSSSPASNPAAAAANTTGNAIVAGKIDLLEGDVRVFDSRNALRTVHVNDNIFEGDAIATGNDGEIHMTMEDTGFIAVRPNTKMRIMQYRANGDEQDKGVIGLLVGSFRSISGWIAKYQPKSYEIRTPTATIGIRGTDHEPKVIPDGSTEGDPGTYDKVNTGGTFIRTPQGSVDVSEHHAGFAPHAARGGFARPRVLEGVPSFFRPTRNEHLIEGKHAAIQRGLQQRREEKHQQYRSNVRQQGMRQAPESRRQQAMQRQNPLTRQGNAANRNEQKPAAQTTFAQRLSAARAAMAQRQQQATGNRAVQGQRGNERAVKKPNEKPQRGQKGSD